MSKQDVNHVRLQAIDNKSLIAPKRKFDISKNMRILVVVRKLYATSKMIKSKFGGFGFYLMALLMLFFLFLLLSAVLQYYFGIELFRISMRNEFEAHIQIALFCIALLIFGSVFTYNANITYIDTANKYLILRNIITQKSTKYYYADLDGYVDTLQRDGWRNSYKTIYLVKNKKYIIKISDFFYSNYDELQKGLNGVTYLGIKNFNVFDSFKVLFRMDIEDV